VDVMKILDNFEKKKYLISLPKIKKNYKMNFFNWSFKEPLVINKYGIPEPTSNKIMYPSILLVPLVAYDEKLYRIGYGGGYYDRYLKKIKKRKKIVTIGLAYSFQKVKKIPIKEHDMKLDFVMTEKNN
jgi:5-formyltetrahydrofolate cyclo-ligase